LGVTILTHSITLTPGTITVSVDEDTILVHALEENSIQDIEKGEMDLRIKNICI
jgi:multicomponent Na+:H+ antiporter subunit E